MYYINKIVWFMMNPMTIGIMAIVISAILGFRGRLRAASWMGVAAALWFWVWGTTAMTTLVGLPLEHPYLAVQDANDLPTADAIVELGGGMGANAQLSYPEMFAAADRCWHAARLYRAGKAPRVVLSGKCERKAALPLVLDFGVPADAVLVDDESRNTYENARFTERLLAENGKPRSRILLVTSAWHMTRALGNFSKTSLEVIPAATDFTAHMAYYGTLEKGWWAFLLPDAATFSINFDFAKEWLGRLARR